MAIRQLLMLNKLKQAQAKKSKQVVRSCTIRSTRSLGFLLIVAKILLTRLHDLRFLF